MNSKGDNWDSNLNQLGQSLINREKALDFILNTAKAAIEKRWTEEKMCYREGRMTV
jgi:hypothetical protein